MLPKDRMNAAGNVPAANLNKGGSSGGSAFTKPIVGLLIFIGVLIGLYYLYQFLYGANAAQDSVKILSGTQPTVIAASSNTADAVAITDITGVLDGGQYSVTFWIYVSSTKEFSPDKIAHLLEISTQKRTSTTASERGKSLLFVGLNPANGTLIVRQNTSDSQGAGGLDNTKADNATYTTNTPVSVDWLLKNYRGGGAEFKKDDRCDIISGIEYQRWLLVTVVGNGRTLDVYIDGKLARSCVYSSAFALQSTDSTARAYFGYQNGGKLKGFFSDGTYYNYALTPDQIWTLYQQGPGGTFSITDFFANLFNVNVSFSTSATMNTPTSGAQTPATGTA